MCLCSITDVCFHSSHALTSDVSIEETARAAEFFLSDGLIITGTATGVQADPQELRGTELPPNVKMSKNILITEMTQKKSTSV